MKNKTVYFIGIKGVGMAALACYFYDLGWQVNGSDIKGKFLTDTLLEDKKINIFEGFDAEHISKDIDLVVVTGAHGGKTNSEALKAESLGIKTLMHGQALGEVMRPYYQVSVAGTHGKTTTSAFISSALYHLGADPSYVVGTPNITDLKTSGHGTNGKYFVAEADEYATCPKTDKTPRFLWHSPDIAVITNIDFDHPDVYKDLSDVENAFLKFTDKIKENGVLIACSDSQSVQTVLEKTKKRVITYGSSDSSEYFFKEPKVVSGGTEFTLFHKEKNCGQFKISLFGKHNILNSLAVIIVLRILGYSYDKVREVLPKFLGTKRRLELIHKQKDHIFFDDYAHHPSEIQSTLQGVRMGYKEYKIFVIFQPHTYSRTKALLTEFSKSFTDSDFTLIAPIYASAREPSDPSFSSRLIVDKIKLNHKQAVYVQNAKEAATYIRRYISAKSVILTMGAGDIYTWFKDLKEIE